MVRYHVNDTADGAGRVVCMQGRKNKVAGHRRFDRDFCRFKVANLTDHDYVGILAQKRAQRGGKGQADFWFALNLVNAM